MSDYEYDYYNGKDLTFPMMSDYSKNIFYLRGKEISPEEVTVILKDAKFNPSTPKRDITPFYCSQLFEAGISVETSFDEAEYVKAKNAYQEIINTREEEFQAKLAEEYDLPPGIGAIVYGVAYQRGHAHGLSNVASCYGDLADLAKQVMSKTIEIQLENDGKCFATAKLLKKLNA